MIRDIQWRKTRFGWHRPAIMRGKLVHGSGYTGWLSMYLGPYRIDVWW